MSVADSTSTALHTDRYELTMLDAALRDGTAHRRCVFELFGRRLSGGRRFGVVAGTGRLLSLIRDFRFGDDELRFLRDGRVVDADTLTWLESYRFTGSITGYREGEAYFPGSPIVTISRLSRTFIRWNGIVAARESLTSRSAQPGSVRICASTASIPSSVPAIVPLIPSFASSSVPLTPLVQQSCASGGLIAARSERRVKR